MKDPLKQGLKPSLIHTVTMLRDLVEVKDPLKQGLKQLSSLYFNILSFS